MIAKIDISFVRSIFIILLACFFISLSAQSDTIPAITKAKTETVDFRVPSKAKIKEYQEDNRFKYDEPQRGISAWDKFIYWLNYLANKIFKAFSDSGIPGIALLLVVVVLLCLLVLRFLGVDYRKVLGKKEIDTPEINIYTENVHEMDFDTLIANAMRNKDYRLVVRFLYLKNLKLLSDKEIIEWKTNKTNYSYQHEISNPNLRSKFLETTLIFDYIWYGEFTLDESRFSDINIRMNDFNNMITNER